MEDSAFHKAVHSAINAGNDWHAAGCKDPAAAARFHKPASPRPTAAPAPAQPKPQLQAKPTPPASPKPAPAAPKLSAAESAAAEKLYAMFERFGREAGGKWFRLGLSVEQAGKLHGTRLGNAFLRHDPNAELDGFSAGGLFHLSAADWPLYAPKADREYGGSRYWKLKSLAAWAAAGVPGRNGKPNPELLARLGGVGKDESLTARECQLGGRRAAAIADGIKLPGRGK